MSDRPKLIIQNSSVSARTWEMLRNEEWIAALPMDGMSVNIPGSWSAMSPGIVLDEADTRAWLEPLAGFNARQGEAHLMIYVDDPGDLFDEAAWDAVVANVRLLAQVAQETGFDGLILDNEEYFGRFLDFPEDHPGAKPRELDAYQARMVEIGREMMEAIYEVFPTAELGVMHGPYLSVEETPAAPPAITGQAGGAYQHELSGPLFTGLLEGKGPDQTLIDMGELYQLRTGDEFAQSQAYRSDDLPALIDWALPEPLRRGWDDAVVQSHIVYIGEFPAGYGQTPASLTSTLLAAFDHSEEAVYLFADWPDVDLFDPDQDNGIWIDAIARAIALADATQEGTRGPDALAGGRGADRLIGDAGGDLLEGGRGDDLLLGGRGADRLSGGRGDDELDGGRGRDRLEGGGGDDLLLGGAGRDVLSGGRGDDMLMGGAGADVFVLERRGGTDRVGDFDPAVDAVDAGGADPAAAAVEGDLHLSLGRATMILEGWGALPPEDVLFV
jgi:hypothetical protein